MEKPSLKSAYIAQDPELKPFLNQFWPCEDISEVIRTRKSANISRSLLQKKLFTQNQDLPNSEKVKTNIELLSSPNTFTVTTGHQVCLFGGPMFTLYKIASTIALAKQFSDKYTDFQFVPVLWMATEDHDWEEVNHYFPAFGEKRTYVADVEGAVGRHVIENSILELFDDKVPSWLRECYAPSTRFGEAFRKLMHHLFGDQGLIILDADDPDLKKAFLPQMKQEIEGHGMGVAFQNSTKALNDLGFKTQIHPRDINLFYLGDGGRNLILENNGQFSLKDGAHNWTKSEILAELAANPANFSPNVAFRPVYQESILPNVAYVGGWAEVSYWLQLKAGFEVFGTSFPLLVPRLHATILKDSQLKAWQSLGFQASDLAKPLHVLYDEYVSRDWDNSELQEKTQKILHAYGEMAEYLGTIDPTRKISMLAEQARRKKVFQKLEKKVKKSLRNQNPKPFREISSLKNAIEPENASQQRFLNFTAFEGGEHSLAKKIIEVAHPEKIEAKWIILH